jgi:hypothetical protein
MLFNKISFLNYFTNVYNAKTFRQIEYKKVKYLIKLFRPVDVGIDLIRIGSKNDGGYLIPNLLDNVKYCFSAGAGLISDFEKDLEKFNIKSFIADGTVSKVSKMLKNYNFERKNIHSYNYKNKININTWISSKIKKDELKKSIFQIDIEGHEFESIHSINDELLSKIKILVIEFHGLELMGNEFYNNIIKSSLEKLNLYFTSVHIHPNNSSGIHSIGKLKVPSALEVTFLNNKFCNKKNKIKKLPHNLDSKNVIKKDDVYLEEYWYK